MAPLQARAVRCFSTGVSLDTPVHGCSHIVTLAPLERNYAISPIYYYYQNKADAQHPEQAKSSMIMVERSMQSFGDVRHRTTPSQTSPRALQRS